ncbi:MAG: hypothetical protein ACKPCP_08420 [Sphaerospermopsis kisseleviana]
MDKHQIAKDFEHLGIDRDMALQLAEIKIKESSIPYYQRSKEESEIFAKAHKIMELKSILPTTTPFINY